VNEAITGVLLDSIRHLRKHVVSLSSVWSGLLPVDNCLNYSCNILHLYLLLGDTKTCHWSLWIRKVSNIARGVAKNAEIRVSPAFEHGNGMTLEVLWSCCSWWRPSPCSCCCASQASIRLETTSRKTQPHVAQSHRIGSETTEHRSFLRVEEGSLSGTLMFDCGNGYAQEEYSVKRERESVARRFRFLGI